MPNRARTANAFPMRTPTSTPRAVDDSVALYVHAYVPVGLSEARWPQVQELVVAQVLRLNVGLETMRRCIRALAYLTSWCVDQRIPIDVEHVLDPDTVERYCTEGLSGTEASMSRVRGDLRRLGRTLTATAPWEPLPSAAVTHCRPHTVVPSSPSSSGTSRARRPRSDDRLPARRRCSVSGRASRDGGTRRSGVPPSKRWVAS